MTTPTPPAVAGIAQARSLYNLGHPYKISADIFRDSADILSRDGHPTMISTSSRTFPPHADEYAHPHPHEDSDEDADTNAIS